MKKTLLFITVSILSINSFAQVGSAHPKANKSNELHKEIISDNKKEIIAHKEAIKKLHQENKDLRK